MSALVNVTLFMVCFQLPGGALFSSSVVLSTRGAPVCQELDTSVEMDERGEGDRPCASGAEIFSLLFGDFDSADPSLMHGVVAVPLADLGKDLEEAEARAEEAAERRGDDEKEEEKEEEAAREREGAGGVVFPLNKMAEVRNPILGRGGGFLGVEGRVVT